MNVIFGTPHLISTPGKRSCDGRLVEAVYGREIVTDCKAILESYGYRCFVDYEPLYPLPAWAEARQKAGYKAEQAKELSYRVQRVNAWSQYYGKDNCVYLSIHVNAAKGDGQWHNAGGWGCYTSRGKTKSDVLAECLYDAAFNNLKCYADLMDSGKKEDWYNNKQVPFRTDLSDGDRDLEADYYVIRHTICPAVLTENLFMDNSHDVDFLLSDRGRQAITRLHVEGILNYINKQKK